MDPATLPQGENTLALIRSNAPLPFFAAVRDAAAVMWAGYWKTGAFVDLAGGTEGTDANALELERRVILSKYLTRANSAGMTPPQETGLLSNSWSGRFHLEMRWWHQSHFPLWGQPDLLDRSHIGSCSRTRHLLQCSRAFVALGGK